MPETITIRCEVCGTTEVISDGPDVRRFIERFGGAPCKCGGRKNPVAPVTGRVVQLGPPVRATRSDES